MPGAGTDKTKRWLTLPCPIVVLVEPQLAENIGACARGMANFGLSRLRLVAPKPHWPNDKARMMAAGADRVLDSAEIHDSLDAAIADCSFVLATTARAHDQAKPVVGAAEAAALMAPRVAAGETVGILLAASATDWKMTRLRSPTAFSRCRSIRLLPRLISRKRW